MLQDLEGVAQEVVTHLIYCGLTTESAPHFCGVVYDNNEIEVINIVRTHVTMFPGHGPSLHLVAYHGNEWELNTAQGNQCYERVQTQRMELREPYDPFVLQAGKQIFQSWKPNESLKI